MRKVTDRMKRCSSPRRPFRAGTGWIPTRILAVMWALACVCISAHANDFDIVIRNGLVIDPETGLQDVRNVGITGGSIAAVTRDAIIGDHVIDARGLVVAPGFVDLHAHGQDLDNSRFQVMDGVTTACEMEIGVADVDAYYKEREGASYNNFGATVSHPRIRMDMTGDPGVLVPEEDAAAGPFDNEQRAELLQRIESGLKRGALGVGMGLQYTPGASREEVQDVFRLAGRYHAPIYVHIRYAGSDPRLGGVNALDEVISAAAVSGTPLHVVHINSSGGPMAPLMLDMVSEASSRGMDITTECYPYGAGMTEISSALFNGDWRTSFGVDYGDLQWVATGERLDESSFARYRKEGGDVILHMNPPEIVDHVVLHKSTMIASDGGFENLKGHPRTAGTHARILRRYVREDGTLPLMQAIAKMSLMPSERLETRCKDAAKKGRIQVGADADIVVFDLDSVADRATYEDPARYSDGMRHVFVNGVQVVSKGALVEGRRPGGGLRSAADSS